MPRFPLRSARVPNIVGKIANLIDRDEREIAEAKVRRGLDRIGIGQILTGLTKPAAEISRGASAHDVFGAAAIVATQAIDQRLLYGTR